MCKVIAIANQKGGVSKTVSTVSLASGLRRLGANVLVIDNDPQGHASKCLGYKEKDNTIYDIVMRLRDTGDIEPSFYIDCIRTSKDGVDVIPSNLRYAGAETIKADEGGLYFLKEIVTVQKPFYDYILIDCPPNLGQLVTSALIAADSVLIPVKPEELCIDGLQQLINTLGRTNKWFNTNTEVEGVLFAIVDQTTLARETMETVRDAYGERINIYEFCIPKAVKAAEFPGSGESIFDYAPKSKVALAYELLAKEVMG